MAKPKGTNGYTRLSCVSPRSVCPRVRRPIDGTLPKGCCHANDMAENTENATHSVFSVLSCSINHRANRLSTEMQVASAN